MATLTERIAAHRAKAEAATPSPWFVEDTTGEWSHRYFIASAGISGVGCDTPHDGTHDTPNATHIAANDPDTVLALLAVAEEMQAQCDACSAEGDICDSCGSHIVLDRLAEVL